MADGGQGEDEENAYVIDDELEQKKPEEDERSSGSGLSGRDCNKVGTAGLSH